MDKMIKTAKNFGNMARATFWTCVVCSVLIAVGALAAGLAPDSFYESVTTSLIFGPVQVELDPGASMDVGSSRLRLVAGLILTDVLVLAGAWIAKIVGNIVHPMTEGKPFDCSVSRNLKKLGILVLAAGGLYEVGLAVVTALCYNYYDLSCIFNPDVVADISVEIRINLWFVVVFAILQLASCVFRYGETLQQLSDETL